MVNLEPGVKGMREKRNHQKPEAILGNSVQQNRAEGQSQCCHRGVSGAAAWFENGV
jgi:hypothetical protein